MRKRQEILTVIKVKQMAIMEAYKNGGLEKRKDAQQGFMRSSACRQLAIHKVITNLSGSTSGVDNVVYSSDQEVELLYKWLEHQVNHPKEYKSIGRKPTTFVVDGTLVEHKVNLPTMKDRALQIVYAITTDPIVECFSDKNSFSFRVGRTPEQAALAVLECFGGKYGSLHGLKVSIKVANKKILSEFILKTITRYNHNGKYFLGQFIEVGWDIDTIVGDLRGAVPPMFCNVALNGLEPAVLEGLPQAVQPKVVRYGNVVIVSILQTSHRETAKELITKFLESRGLQLKESIMFDIKTDGVEFLGWKLRSYKRNIHNDRIDTGELTVKLMPSDEVGQRLRGKIKEIFKYKNDDDARIIALNSRVQSYCNYYKSSFHSRDSFNDVEQFLLKKITARELAKFPDIGPKRLHEKMSIVDYELKSKEGTKRVRPTKRLQPMKYHDIKVMINKVYTNPYIKG